MTLRDLALPLNLRVYCITAKCSASSATGQDLLHVDLPAILLASAASAVLLRLMASRSQLGSRAAALVVGGSAYCAATAYRRQLIAEQRLAELGGGAAGDPHVLRRPAAA